MEELIKIIEGNYDLKVYSGEKVKNAYKLETDQGPMCFKQSHYDIIQYKFIIDAMEYLIGRGYKHILKIINTKNGRNYIPTNVGYGFMCDWIYADQVDFESEKELILSIEALSKLHLSSMGFEFSCNSGIRNLYGKWIKRFKRRCDELLYFKTIVEGKTHKSEFDKLFLHYFIEYYSEGVKAVNKLTSSDYIEVMERHKGLSGLCHHDTANHNFLITPQDKIILIDFDYCIYDSYLHDLGSIIIRNLKHGRWFIERMALILKVYNEYIKIDDSQLTILKAFVLFPQDYWQVGLQYYIEKQNWEEEVFLKRLKRIVDDTVMRKVFLKELEGGKMLDFLK